MKIREARLGDEEQLARVHIQAWQESYTGLIAQSYLDQLPSETESRILNWRKNFDNPQRWLWVAENDRGIQGFIIFGLPRDEGREGYIELGAIYLLKSEKNKGVGYALLSTGFSKMLELGYQKAYCWTLEDNPTQRFYERTGAQRAPETKQDEIGGIFYNELAYEWPTLKSFRF